MFPSINYNCSTSSYLLRHSISSPSVVNVGEDEQDFDVAAALGHPLIQRDGILTMYGEKQLEEFIFKGRRGFEIQKQINLDIRL